MAIAGGFTQTNHENHMRHIRFALALEQRGCQVKNENCTANLAQKGFSLPDCENHRVRL